MTIHISKMTGKLEGFQAISTNTVSNEYCQKQYKKQDAKNICTFCYSHNMLNTFRKNMQASLQRNTDLLNSKVLHPDALPVINSAFFRFNAHGELALDKKQGTINLENYVNIAIKNPHCTFSLWTKRFDIIKPYFDNHEKPKNLILIYSSPLTNHIMTKVPKHFDKTFNTVVETDFVEKQNCTGQKCKDCLLCYKKDTTSIIVEKVKTYGKKKLQKILTK
ncbi:hypothetical protein Greip_gp26 [Pelagibacter phage Greip EXVC021P]|nr:hypothetical protein Greip_gp26 [Pelagibacter phage Greip EXVC021P]